MNLGVGMYVRTYNGTIFKITNGDEDKKYIDISYSTLSWLEDEDYTSYAYNKNDSLFRIFAKKASYNLMDLIELGDYVNGKEVTEILIDSEGVVTDITYMEETEGQRYSLLPINNIITKEQLEKVKYEVKND